MCGHAWHASANAKSFLGHEAAAHPAHIGLERSLHGPSMLLPCCLMRRPANRLHTGGLCAHLVGLARRRVVQVLPKLVRPLDYRRLRGLRHQAVLEHPPTAGRHAAPCRERHCLRRGGSANRARHIGEE